MKTEVGDREKRGRMKERGTRRGNEKKKKRRRKEEEGVGGNADQKKGREREECERTKAERGERARGKGKTKNREYVVRILMVSWARVTRTSHTSRHVILRICFYIKCLLAVKFWCL